MTCTLTLANASNQGQGDQTNAQTFGRAGRSLRWFQSLQTTRVLVGVVLALVRLWALVVGCMVSGDRCRCIGCRAVQGGWSRPAAWRWWFGLARVHPHPAFWSYYSVLCVAMATDGERRLYIFSYNGQSSTRISFVFPGVVGLPDRDKSNCV